MGRDKATLAFCGRPLIEIAVEKLRSFCADVSIVGNRDDLAPYAPVVHEARVDCGPAAGIEAGLKAAKQEWALFVPVDVPLVPASLLRNWGSAVLGWAEKDAKQDELPYGSYLLVNREEQPSFCLLPEYFAKGWMTALDSGKRRLTDVLADAGHPGGGIHLMNAARCTEEKHVTPLQIDLWFTNVNTPQELAEAEAWAQTEGWPPV